MDFGSGPVFHHSEAYLLANIDALTNWSITKPINKHGELLVGQNGPEILYVGDIHGGPGGFAEWVKNHMNELFFSPIDFILNCGMSSKVRSFTNGLGRQSVWLHFYRWSVRISTHGFWPLFSRVFWAMDGSRWATRGWINLSTWICRHVCSTLQTNYGMARIARRAGWWGESTSLHLQ